MKNMNIETQVFKTSDYGIFKFMKGNRRINNRNYAKLVSSMKEKQLMIPICVNEEFEIIDGQHRFKAASELGLPVYFYIVNCYGIEEVKRANMVSSNWTKQDFLELHMGDGIQSYIDFGGIKERYNLNVRDLLKLFAKRQQKTVNIMSKMFEDGMFVSDGKEEVISFLIALEDFSFFDYSKTTQFTGAFMSLYFHPDYDHQKMKERLKTRSGSFTKKSTIDEYLMMLTREIYSFGAVRKPLYYDVATKRFYS